MMTGAPFPPDPPPAAGSSVHSAVPPPARGVWGTVVRRVRMVLLVVVVAVALLGAVVTPALGMLVIAPLVGTVLAGALALVDPDFPRDTSSRRGVVYAAAAGVLLVPLANGLVALGSLGGVVLLVLLALGPLVATDGPVDEAGEVPSPGVLAELLPALPTAQLLAEWRASEALVGSPSRQAAAAEVRALLLDELSRRDPDGVAGWLGAGGSPESYISPDRDRAG